jgi:hypothetical protein
MPKFFNTVRNALIAVANSVPEAVFVTAVIAAALTIGVVP